MPILDRLILTNDIEMFYLKNQIYLWQFYKKWLCTYRARQGPLITSPQLLKSLSYATAKRYAASVAISRDTADKF